MAGSTARLVVAGGLFGATVLALAGCGTERGGSVALGAPPAPAVTTPSNSGVVFVPLDPPSAGTGTPSGAGSSSPGTPGATGAPGGGTGRTPGSTSGSTGGGGTTGPSRGSGSGGATGGTTAGGGSGGGSSSGGGTGGGGTGGGGTGGGLPTPTPTPTGPGGSSGSGGTPQTPAALTVTALLTADTAQRWCQRVTLTLVNSGDLAATSGTVTFATHVIGALGVDWWTYRTSQPLAAPVAGHTRADESWTVCLDSWRVPAGMHLETRTATLS